jgi:hypothetical protein
MSQDGTTNPLGHVDAVNPSAMRLLAGRSGMAQLIELLDRRGATHLFSAGYNRVILRSADRTVKHHVDLEDCGADGTEGNGVLVLTRLSADPGAADSEFRTACHVEMYNELVCRGIVK